MGNLDDFLKGGDITDPQPVDPVDNADPAPADPQADPAAQPPADPAPTASAQPRGPDGKFVSKGDPVDPAQAASPAASGEPQLDHAALIGERRRRQESDERIKALEAQLQQLQNPPAPPPSIWEDEQGWQQNFGENVVNSAVQRATINARIEMSEMMMRQSHSDFETKKAKWLELVGTTPGLAEKGIADAHPWNFAYNYVTNHERMNELSAVNLDDLKAKLREELKAELAAAQPAPPAPIPDTLADAQSARSSGEALTVPSFDQILGRKP